MNLIKASRRKEAIERKRHIKDYYDIKDTQKPIPDQEIIHDYPFKR